MNKFDITPSSNLSPEKIINSMDLAVKSGGLTIKSRGTLKTIPGCVHWHITKNEHKGTLEATFDRNNFRLWLCYHDNRYCDWMDEAIEKIKKTLELQ